MKLKKGQKAPLFIKSDIWGNEINLEKIENQKILLSFFRYAECALCNLRIAELMKFRSQLEEKNIKLITVFESSIESLRFNVAGKHPFTFTIIAEPNRELYNQYYVFPSWIKLLRTVNLKAVKSVVSAFKLGFKPGGKVEGIFHQIPADFLIDKNIIQIAHYGSNVIDHIPIDEILNY